MQLIKLQGFGLSAPPLDRISNQFVEDLKKIADLRPLIEDLSKEPEKLIIEELLTFQQIQEYEMRHFHNLKKGFGRRYIFSC